VKGQPTAGRWEGTFLCSSNQGTGTVWMELREDLSFTSEWKAHCYGETIVSYKARGAYNLSGEDFKFAASGNARSDMGPSSHYELRAIGTFHEGTAQGTYDVTFDGEGWTPEESGTWKMVKVK
jgi:hypothetical protein